MKVWRILFPLIFSMIIASAASSEALQEEQMAPMTEIAKKAIQAGKIPGAVILIGHAGKVIYRKVLGLSALKPKKLPMTINTIFDVAIDEIRPRRKKRFLFFNHSQGGDIT